MIKLELDLSLEEAERIIKYLRQLRTYDQESKTIKVILSWPYWCWNCGIKIESPPKPNEKNEMSCPSCGVQIPEA